MNRNLKEWEIGENGKPIIPRKLKNRFLPIVNEQMEKYLQAELLNTRFSIRAFATDLMAAGYLIAIEDINSK